MPGKKLTLEFEVVAVCLHLKSSLCINECTPESNTSEKEKKDYSIINSEFSFSAVCTRCALRTWRGSLASAKHLWLD